jgi:hypothetical protein
MQGDGCKAAVDGKYMEYYLHMQLTCDGHNTRNIPPLPPHPPHPHTDTHTHIFTLCMTSHVVTCLVSYHTGHWLMEDSPMDQYDGLD